MVYKHVKKASEIYFFYAGLGGLLVVLGWLLHQAATPQQGDTSTLYLLQQQEELRSELNSIKSSLQEVTNETYK